MNEKDRDWIKQGAIILFCLMLVSALIGATANYTLSKYHDECIESHVENTFTYKGCVVKVIFNNGTTDCDNNCERINTSKTVCTKYALVRNATQEELSQ